MRNLTIWDAVRCFVGVTTICGMALLQGCLTAEVWGEDRKTSQQVVSRMVRMQVEEVLLRESDCAVAMRVHSPDGKLPKCMHQTDAEGRSWLVLEPTATNQASLQPLASLRGQERVACRVYVRKHLDQDPVATVVFVPLRQVVEAAATDSDDAGFDRRVERVCRLRTLERLPWSVQQTRRLSGSRHEAVVETTFWNENRQGLPTWQKLALTPLTLCGDLLLGTGGILFLGWVWTHDDDGLRFAWDDRPGC